MAFLAYGLMVTLKHSFSTEAFERALSDRTKIVAITQMSNVLGTAPPVKEIIRLAHERGVLVLVDGSQGAVHLDVDVRDLDADFYVLTGHKIYGPTGIGVLYGKRELLESLPPFVYDTEPSSRAVVVVRRNGFSVVIEALRRIQCAFYAENRDVTRFDALAEIAGELGFSIDLFHADWDADAAKRETRQDFALARSVGVRGFPTLIAGAGEGREYALMTHGFMKKDVLLPALRKWRSTID